MASRLYTAELPDSDPLIHTSGEKRVSNFLLWQIAYAVPFVTERLWADFCRKDVLCGILDHQKRDRRFGRLCRSEEHPVEDAATVEFWLEP